MRIVAGCDLENHFATQEFGTCIEVATSLSNPIEVSVVVANQTSSKGAAAIGESIERVQNCFPPGRVKLKHYSPLCFLPSLIGSAVEVSLRVQNQGPVRLAHGVNQPPFGTLMFDVELLKIQYGGCRLSVVGPLTLVSNPARPGLPAGLVADYAAPGLSQRRQ
jgi:hypothetical protein